MSTTRPARELLHAFLPELRPHRTVLARAYLLAGVAVAAGVLAPWPLKVLIDGVLADPAAGLLLPGGARIPPGRAVALLALGGLALAVLRTLASHAERKRQARVREGLALGLRDRLLRHLERLPPQRAGRRRSGETVHRLVSDAHVFARCLTRVVPVAVQHLATSIALLLGLVWLDPWVGGVALVALPLLALRARVDGRRLALASQRKRRLEGDAAGISQEVVRGLPALQATGDLAHARESFLGAMRRALAASVAEIGVGLSMERTLQLGQAATLAAATALGAARVVQGACTVGDLTVALSWLTALLKPVEKIHELGSSLTRGLAAGERLLEVLRERPAVTDAPGARPAEPGDGRLELCDVWFAHPERGATASPVLRGASAEFRRGELTVVVGASGAGKSTLLALLLRLFDPDRGRVRLDGTPLPELQVDSLRRLFAVLPQRAHLFAGTVRDCLTRPGEEVAEKQLWRALGRAGIDAEVRALPGGLDAHLGEDGVDLSGGQRQRLALARIFLLDRPIVLLDEPTAGVDRTAEEEIVGAVARLRPTRTVVAVSHRPALLEVADRVLVLDGGRLREAAREQARPARRAVGASR